jgi:hypothetical protein
MIGSEPDSAHTPFVTTVWHTLTVPSKVAVRQNAVDEWQSALPEPTNLALDRKRRLSVTVMRHGSCVDKQAGNAMRPRTGRELEKRPSASHQHVRPIVNPTRFDHFRSQPIRLDEFNIAGQTEPVDIVGDGGEHLRFAAQTRERDVVTLVC